MEKRLTGGPVMKTTLAVLCAVLTTFLGAAATQGIQYTDTVDYDIQVRLDPGTHGLDGTEVVHWTNRTRTPTNELWWHLYLNAFSSSKSTFMKELGGTSLRGGKVHRYHWGWTRITTMTLDDGTDLLPRMTFERPDDHNPDDFTVAKVTLPFVVQPGASVTIHLRFLAKLPKVIARTGWAGQFYLVGQWFPKLGVYEAAGVRDRTVAGWNCHQFHANSEFYSDFGTYTVSVTVPQGWVVGGGGIEVSREKIAEGTSRFTRVTYRDPRVHDFAWTAAPATLMAVITRKFDPSRDVPKDWLENTAKLLHRSPADLELPPVRLRLLIPRSQVRLAGRMLNAARLAIAWYGLHYGPYPYPQLTIVSPPITAREAGGMEYPTFITTGASRWMLYPPAKWVPLIEIVTIHEFGHQYFYGLLASNEFEEAWLDEGFNSFAEASCEAAIMKDHLAPDVPWFEPWVSNRMALLFRKLPVEIDRFSWKFRARRDYFTASYQKTALALRTLRNLAGASTFATAMRTYAERFRFRHPGGDDFFKTFNEVAGTDYSWFFDQAFRAEKKADWAVLGVRQRRVTKLEGYRWTGSEWVTTGKPSGTPATSIPATATPDTAPKHAATATPGAHGNTKAPKIRWNVKVSLGRPGSFIGPVHVELVWADGSKTTKTWNSTTRWIVWSFPSSQRLKQVVIDPDHQWLLETNRGDNYWSDHRLPGAVSRRLWVILEPARLLNLVPLPWS
ncbi:MAG: M1 family metallopeptidase [Acidobacteria bacterium]|nr:M1 family metallopeptidase [Acidobacteriota bacterium]